MALPQHIKKLASDAVSEGETIRQIRLVSVNQIDAPLLTPKADTRRVGGCALLEYLWSGNGLATPHDRQERDDGR
jgi:hypothetical protein